jgi:NADH dehydrogenase
MAHTASRWYTSVTPDDQHWVLVEATDGILPMVDERLADAATEALRHRGIDIRLSTVLESVDDGVVTLSDGDQLSTDTLVWAAGVAPSPLLATLPVPSRTRAPSRSMRPCACAGSTACGPPATAPPCPISSAVACPPSAQYALREGRHLADNLTAVVHGRETHPFRYEMIGELLTLDRGDGIAQIRGRHLRGWLPWYLRRLYHIGRIPSARRKVQVWTDWTLRLLMGRDVVSLGELRQPNLPLERAAASQTEND